MTFFYYVKRFIKNLPYGLSATISYLHGWRPYYVMAVRRSMGGLTRPFRFDTILLPPNVAPYSIVAWEQVRNKLHPVFQLLSNTFIYHSLEPLPFRKYLWNHVLMNWW
jgi:hypothetical protein